MHVYNDTDITTLLSHLCIFPHRFDKVQKRTILPGEFS